MSQGKVIDLVHTTFTLYLPCSISKSFIRGEIPSANATVRVHISSHMAASACLLDMDTTYAVPGNNEVG